MWQASTSAGHDAAGVAPAPERNRREDRVDLAAVRVAPEPGERGDGPVCEEGEDSVDGRVAPGPVVVAPDLGWRAETPPYRARGPSARGPRAGTRPGPGRVPRGPRPPRRGRAGRLRPRPRRRRGRARSSSPLPRAPAPITPATTGCGRSGGCGSSPRPEARASSPSGTAGPTWSSAPVPTAPVAASRSAASTEVGERSVGTRTRAKSGPAAASADDEHVGLRAPEHGLGDRAEEPVQGPTAPAGADGDEVGRLPRRPSREGCSAIVRSARATALASTVAPRARSRPASASSAGEGSPTWTSSRTGRPGRSRQASAARSLSAEKSVGTSTRDQVMRRGTPRAAR